MIEVCRAVPAVFLFVQAIGDLVEKSGPQADHFAKAAASMRPRQDQFFPGTRDADVEQPAFFFRLFDGFQRTRQREQSFFHAGQEHDRILEPLGGVEGHQCDAFGIVFVAVYIREQRHFFEVFGQRGVGMLVVVLGHAGDELLDVVRAAAAVGGIFDHQLLHHARIDGDSLYQGLRRHLGGQ